MKQQIYNFIYFCHNRTLHFCCDKYYIFLFSIYDLNNFKIYLQIRNKFKTDIMSASSYCVNKFKLIFNIQPYHTINGWPLNDKMINQPRNRNYFPKNFLYRKVRTITGSTTQVINNLLLAILYVILPSKT